MAVATATAAGETVKAGAAEAVAEAGARVAPTVAETVVCKEAVATEVGAVAAAGVATTSSVRRRTRST